MSWSIERRQPDRPRPFELFLGRGGACVVSQFIVMTAWLVLTPKGHKLTKSALGRVTATLLLSAGVAAGVSGALVLGKSLSPFPKPPPQAQLVRRSIYSIIRHPIYTGLIALSFGWACLWGSGRGVVLALIQAVLLDNKARREELWLREKFSEYDEYAVKVRRLIPWLY